MKSASFIASFKDVVNLKSFSFIFFLLKSFLTWGHVLLISEMIFFFNFVCFITPHCRTLHAFSNCQFRSKCFFTKTIVVRVMTNGNLLWSLNSSVTCSRNALMNGKSGVCLAATASSFQFLAAPGSSVTTRRRRYRLAHYVEWIRYTRSNARSVGNIFFLVTALVRLQSV